MQKNLHGYLAFAPGANIVGLQADLLEKLQAHRSAFTAPTQEVIARELHAHRKGAELG
jgi:hypothetical protein